MTFTEAAAEVLRLVGKPLHYKDITDIAIEKNLLSHVGKSPEITMGSRLAALLKKGPKENPLVRVKPGVFALRVWSESGGVAPAADAEAEVEAPEAAPVAVAAVAPAPVAAPAHPAGGPRSRPPRSSPAPVVKAEPAPRPALLDVEPSEIASPAAVAAAAEIPSEAERAAGDVSTTVVEVAAASSTSDEAAAVDGDDAVTRPLQVTSPMVMNQVATPIPGAVAPSDRSHHRQNDRHHDRHTERHAPKPASPPVAVSPPREADELLRAGLAANALDVFSEEEDDDKPILGAEPEAGAGRRRRRRRRRGGDAGVAVVDPPGDGLPSYTVSPAFGEDGIEVDAPAAQAGDASADAEGTPIAPSVTGRREERSDRNDRGDRSERSDRNERGDRTERQERGDRNDRGARDERRDERAPKLAEGEEPVGRDVAEIAINLLSSFDRNAGPVPMRALSDAAIRRNKLTGDPAFVQAQLSAATRADNLRREAAGLRPRFRFAGARIALTDWVLGTELIRLEAEALAAVDRYREAARRVLARKIGELPGQGFLELVVLLLERQGISQLRAVRRPGSNPGESHLTGVQKTLGGEARIAIIVRRDGREVGRERVADIRGSLHHYGPATQALLVTSGQVLSGAREEAAVSTAAPVALLDGLAIARSCEELSIAVVPTHVTIAVADLDFLENLRGQGQAS